MVKFSQGPLRAYKQADGLYTVRSQSSGLRVACDMLEGDALKLAAADDLLEACRALDDALYELNPTALAMRLDRARAYAQEAIAKAEGRI